MSPASARIVETAARLARERLAPRAARYDREAANPVESWRDLHAENIIAAAVPASHGGLGLDMPTYVEVIRALAQGCASTAMTLHMHSTVMRFIAALGTPEQQRRYFAEVVGPGRMFGSWGSEPAVSLSRTFLMETTVRADGDGFVIDGVKYFCTMALGASFYMVWCALDGEADMGKALCLALVPADAAGLATDGKWDTLGMRATFSPSVSFKDVRVPAEAALDFTLDYAKKRVVKPENVAVAQDPTVQRHLGGLVVHLDAARLVLRDAAAGWPTAGVAERGNLANRAKLLGTEVGLEVTSKCIQVVGGRGAYRDYPVERAFRDARTATLMPPTMDRMAELIGKSALGLTEGMFRISGAPGDATAT